MTSEAQTHLAFTGGTLDRADHIRIDANLLAAAWDDPRARLLTLDGLDPLVDGDGRLVIGAVPPGLAMKAHVLLGLLPDGAPLFVAIEGLGSDEPPTFPSKVWEVIPLLGYDEAAMFGTARCLVDWHRRHPFCARCGHPTDPVKGGWARQCGACQAEHFPRTDPVVIMLAEYEGKVLIGRNSRFPPGRFSALAGFVEPGETIEEAVRRELMEEAGVAVGRVDYLMSQPWPFPSQLMIACIAQAHGDALTLDETELAEAMWVSRDDVRAAFAGEDGARFQPPSTIAVAHHMLRRWLES